MVLAGPLGLAVVAIAFVRVPLALGLAVAGSLALWWYAAALRRYRYVSVSDAGIEERTPLRRVSYDLGAIDQVTLERHVDVLDHAGTSWRLSRRTLSDRGRPTCHALLREAIRRALAQRGPINGEGLSVRSKRQWPSATALFAYGVLVVAASVLGLVLR